MSDKPLTLDQALELHKKVGGPLTLTLAQVLEGADRAATRVAAWPQWKRDLSDAWERRLREDMENYPIDDADWSWWPK